mgnify:FL=1
MRRAHRSFIAVMVLAVVMLMLQTVPSFCLAQTKYNSADEAWRDGARLYNARRYAEARAPLEAAFELSDDTKFKVRVSRALMEPYRQLPDIGSMLETVDYIFEHGDSAVEKSLVARSLSSFARERGKDAEVVQIYESRLKQDPRSRPALYILSDIYKRVQPNPKRQAEVAAVLKDVERGDEAQLAKSLETRAGEQPEQAATHWKDAAAAWLRAEERDKSLAALAMAEKVGPELRNDLLAHFWHRGMADTYLALERAKEAIPHYERAIEKTTIEGYLKACREQLEKARAAAGS